MGSEGFGGGGHMGFQGEQTSLKKSIKVGLMKGTIRILQSLSGAWRRGGEGRGGNIK